MREQKKRFNWLKLDNAAKIYPSVASKRTTAVFRLSVTLLEDIDIDCLQQALDLNISRYPYFNMRLKSGFFWSYLEKTKNRPLVREENQSPCRKITKKLDNKLLFRVIYYKRKISIEVSHILTDGTGAVFFLKDMLVEYFRLKKKNISNIEELYHYKKSNSAEYIEDAYLKYYKKDIPYPERALKAFHINEKLLPSEYHKIVTGIVEIAKIKKLTKKYSVTITEFLTALHLYSLQEYIFQQPQKVIKRIIKPIRILVPINLRKMFVSKTLRNFFLAVKPGIDVRLGRYSLEEIIKIVYHYMRVEVNDKFIQQQIARNVGSEKNIFIRLIPRFLKIPIEKIIYKVISSSQHSGLLTNVGQVLMPEQLASEIERFEIIANPNAYTRLNCGVISFKNKLYISFGSLVESTEVQRIFFSTLRELDVDVIIETND